MAPERDRQAVQRAGEDAAAALLEREGWTVLHRNWRRRLGELDIVARQGDLLAFVEVKARRAPAFVSPALGVDWRKQRQLRRVADAYLAIERPRFRRCRFDVVSVVIGEGEVSVERLAAAF
ncbi:MAG TPA: YraN family protein [Actinomycetota bacterium]|nr:YraN family protein [Actinomycetota bacterium]